MRGERKGDVYVGGGNGEIESVASHRGRLGYVITHSGQKSHIGSATFNTLQSISMEDN